MRISDLREFIRLAQTLSFTQTAREFYMDQSAFSRHIARTEEELGVKLLSRTRQGVLLTRAGEVFLEDAMKVLDDYDRAIRNLERVKDGTLDALSIGYLFGASDPCLPEAVAAMQAGHPELGINLMSLELGDVSHALMDDRIDIALTTALPNSAYPIDSFFTVELADDPFVAIMPRNHELAASACLSVDDLAGHRVVIQPLKMSTDNSAETMQLLRRFKDGTYLQETQYDVASISTLLKTGRYIAITSKHVIDILGPSFICVPLEEARDIPFKIMAVWKRAHDTPIIRDFANLLHDAFTRERTAASPECH